MITSYSGKEYKDTDYEMKTKVAHNGKEITLAKLICLGELFAKEKGYPEAYSDRNVDSAYGKISVAEAIYIDLIDESEADNYV